MLNTSTFPKKKKKKNHFVIMPSGGMYFEASIFLRDVVPSSMLHPLKFLEVIIPPADTHYMSLGSSAYEDCDKTVSYLQETLSRPGWLTLRIYFQDFQCLDEASPYRRSVVSREQGLWTIVAMYERILFPLS